MNLIFLDVDGVLNSSAYFEPFLEQEPAPGERYENSDYYLRMLAEIYHTCDARIVLSSSWRTLNSREDEDAAAMYRYLEQSLARYQMGIMSTTPVIDMNRPLEIATWLKNHGDLTALRFVSLDDNFKKADYDQYNIGHCLVRTSFFCDRMEEGGLCKKRVKEAVRRLTWHPLAVRLYAKLSGYGKV